MQIFRPVKKANRTHSKCYVEDLSTKIGRKRCAKMIGLNVSVLP
ncbi:secretion protein HlyD [uncultured Selenomonas sp.]|nr:secretion protein HlyD [uncultured Selenomonas sp.]